MAGALTAAIAAAFSGSDSSDPYFEYTTLLLPGNGTNGAQNNTFLDGSTNNFTITRNGNTTQGTFSPFSQTGWGNYFASSTSNLKFASNAVFAIGTGNFTVECFVNFNAWTGTNQTIFLQDISGTGNLQITRNSGANNLIVTIANSAVISYSWTPTLGQWYYIAIVRSGTGSNQVALYIDGTSVATGTSSGSIPQQQAIIGGLDWASGYAIQGYISNFRYSNIARTISVPTTSYTSDANTLILTCQSNRFVDNSASPKTITVNGTTSVVAFSPFNPTASWSAATYGGSGYFDGSGDYLDPPANAAFQFGTGDFCLEGWIYPTDTTTRAICGQRTGSSGDNSWVLSCNPTNASSFGYVYFHTDNTAVFGSSVAINTNAWTHVVFTCVSGRYRIFQNGILSGTTLGSYNFNQTTGPRLGAEIRTAVGAAAAFLGWMNGWRITKGGIPSAYSTASTTVGASIFTPPSTPATNSESLTAGSLSLLLNFTNAGIYDATSKNDLETVGNAQISTTQSKWGGSSMSFDGTGDYLLMPSSQLNAFGTGDFTIEMWFYLNNTSAIQALYDSRPTSTDGAYSFIYVNAGGTAIIYDVSAGTRITGTATVSTSTWHHLAISRSGTSTKMFFNGTQVGSTYTDSTNYLVGTSRPAIGSSGFSLGTYPLNGYIDDLRVSRVARYTANFTAPTAAFPTL